MEVASIKMIQIALTDTYFTVSAGRIGVIRGRHVPTNEHVDSHKNNF